LLLGVQGANWGFPRQLQKLRQQNPLESGTAEGDSPVRTSDSSALWLAFQSSTELVELRVNQGGPPSKAKYYSTTDSEPVGRLNDEKYPY
jgi:hypothetical protein